MTRGEETSDWGSIWEFVVAESEPVDDEIQQGVLIQACVLSEEFGRVVITHWLLLGADIRHNGSAHGGADGGQEGNVLEEHRDCVYGEKLENCAGSLASSTQRSCRLISRRQTDVRTDRNLVAIYKKFPEGEKVDIRRKFEHSFNGSNSISSALDRARPASVMFITRGKTQTRYDDLTLLAAITRVEVGLRDRD